MDQRKVFADSITPLPDQQGLTPTGLMINAAKVVDKSQKMDLLFSLSMDPATQKDLEDKVAAGQVVTPAELRTKYVPDQKDIDALVTWLKAQGYEDTRVSPNGTSVYTRATVPLIESSLQVNMVSVTKNGLTYTAAKNAPSLPADVGKSVHAIIGLQPFRHPNKHRKAPVPPTVKRPATTLTAQAVVNAPNQPPYLVSEILKAYNADGLGLTGAGQTIAILIDSFANDADLTQFWNQNNIGTTLAQIQKINVANADLAAPEGEETLDTEWASGIAPDATIRVYASKSLDFVDLDQALDAILTDVQTIPSMRQLSISLGLGETFLGGPQGEVATEHQKFLRLAAVGVNVFVSAGDAGSNPDMTGQIPTGPLQVEYAASDPSVVAVGGTTLVLAPDGTVSNETCWSAGGGGISTFFDRPVWQAGAGVPAGTKRLVPDVALTADPNEGAYLVLNGSVQQYGGTSWSAPVWAGFCALLNEARSKAGKPLLPFLNPLIYPLAGTVCFRDITTGSNGAYNAGAGYDMVTGIGVPDVGELVKALTS